MKVDFQISYTLDVLCYINCMINEDKKKLYDEDMERFMPMLGTISDKYLRKLQKMNEKRPTFMIHLVAVLISHQHLHDWTTLDLLSNPKGLIGEFKKSHYFKNAKGELKKFIHDDFVKSINYVKVIAIDLERLGFKKFWLKEKLPVLKERIFEYQAQLDAFDIVKHMNTWVIDKEKFKCDHWYVLAYSGNQFVLLLEYFSVVAPIVLADHLFERVVSYVLKTQDYKSLMRKFKPDGALKAEFKKHADRGMYPKLIIYVEACLKMAMKVYLMETLPDLVVISLPDGYPFAHDILGYLREHGKDRGVAMQHYMTGMMKHFSKK